MMVAAAVIGGGAISGVTGLIGSSQSAGAQQQAAQAQLAATQAAIQAEQGQFQTGLGYTSPYAQMGADVYKEAENELGLGNNQPVYGTYGGLGAAPSLTDMTQLPGYSFTLQQGLNATQNAAAAQGLGVSGVAMKGAVGYAENLANTYYNNYLSNYWANQNNRYNMLAGLANQGLGAATSIQGNAVTAGGQIGTTGLSGQAAANNLNVGAANTSAAGLQGFGSSIGSNLLLASALGNTGSTIASGPASNIGTSYSGNIDVSGGGP